MFTVSTVKPLCFTEPSLILQQKFYSRYTSQNLKFFFNDFRENINLKFFNKFPPKFEPLKFSSSFKDHSLRVFKSCTKQCEFILAHRIRRSLQIFSLYKKLWGDFRLMLLVQKFNFNAAKHRKLFYSASLTTGFAWEKKRIPEDEILRLEKEITEAKLLHDGGNPEGEIPEEQQGKWTGDPCNCDRCKHLNNDDEWQVFFKSTFLKIWRKEHEKYKGQGLYVYKVYGRWNDVTANDLFQVQIDCKYRKEWDTNSVQLYIVDSDTESNSDVLYWEFLFPKMFYNRDYVCNRRYKIDREKKLMTIVSESTEHPLCPEKPPIHRVKEYWSHIVIKPKEDFDKPGVEFTITYFDNPELSIPTYIALFYSIAGMPDYLKKQKEAALKLAKYREEQTRLSNEKETQSTPAPPPPQQPTYQQKSPDKRFLIL